MVFHISLVQKEVSVDSFTKRDAKWPRARFGLGRAGWAGPPPFLINLEMYGEGGPPARLPGPAAQPPSPQRVAQPAAHTPGCPPDSLL